MNRARMFLELGEHPKHFRKLAALTEREAKTALMICEESEDVPDYRFNQMVQASDIKPQIKTALLAIYEAEET